MSTLLIADSGGTKTSWTFLKSDGTHLLTCRTEGINPLLLNDSDIARRLHEMSVKLQACSVESETVIFFYGSGVTQTQETRIEELLKECLSPVIPLKSVHAHSDMLGAARALCQHEEGIACILGTGSNSCIYDGHKIVAQTPSLGFILGDEGGGVYMGKLLLNTLYKGRCEESLLHCFEDETGETLPSVINRVYKQPMPNTFIASLTRFIQRHKDKYEVLQVIVRKSFEDFIHYNILPYRCTSIPVHAMGGTVNAFREEWRQTLQAAQLKEGRIEQSPAKGLIEYHTTSNSTTC